MNESELCDCGARLRRVTINAEPAGSVCEECGIAMPDAVRFVPTNPPVPATPLDVEACVRLLDDLILMLAPHDQQSIADANLLRALASALPGMGKVLERLREIELLTPDIAQILDGWHADGTAWSPWDESVRQRLADWHIKYAARAAQPEETSADGR